MRKGNSIICSKSESEKLVKELQAQCDRACKDFNALCRPAEPVRIEVKAVPFEMGWGVASIMYFGNHVLKTYPLAELALIDINTLIINALRRTNNGENTTNSSN